MTPTPAEEQWVRRHNLRRSVALGDLRVDGSYRDEWTCDHGVGHPIRGTNHHGGGIHGCDGCCGRAAEVTS